MSGFNPDDYLAAPPEPVNPDDVRSISPEAEERAIRALLAPQVGAGETALSSAVGGIPLGNLTTNALAALVLRARRPRLGATIPEAAQAELRAMGEDVAVDPGLLDEYRAVRDERRERAAAGAEQNPNAARAGTAAGIGLSVFAPLPGVTVAARGGAAAPRGLARLAALARTPAGSRVASAVATGGAYGALGGATDGEADLTRGDIAGVLRDTVRGAGTGAAWGAAGGAVAEGARAGIPWLRRLAVRNTKEAIQDHSNIGAATRKPMRDESAAQMLDDGQLRAFDNVANIYDRIVPAADAEGARLGRIIADLERSGYTGPNAQALAQQLEAQGRRLSPNISSDKSPARVFADEAANVRNVPRAAAEGPLVPNPGAQSPYLGLQQAENIKSSIQGRAKFQKLESNEREDALKQASRTVRQATEDALFEQAARRDQEAREAFEGLGYTRSEMDPIGVGSVGRQRVQQFLDQKARTGRYLDAAQFSTRGRSKFDQRPREGLTDSIAGAAAGGDNILKQKFWARVHSELRSRSASTIAVGSEGLRRSLASGRAAERLGVGGASFGPFAADEAERWADSQDLDDPNLNPKVRALLELLRRRNPPQER